ncbi:hypothetical protein ABZ816_41375 [Actinosynnema sp. NPDC047251]|uniref:Uncharacterized protein n=1 Tax=Saccharothrix espanaensis (strain ATCC 51144 / DSM 44229 / JCM 9112 / NBRC 15066 / NRRL 15764) TaxID=1179773 RepID=K0JVX0_SACES|nr:hypothetical protein [Saccharothrix espanaensis]CCH30131.1 hypothetical protein BN6_28200 [Saccharothrix espanaensis DSM 44229]
MSARSGPENHPVTRLLRFALVLVGVVWLVVVLTSIAEQPAPGAADAQELARSLETALNARDAAAMKDLLGGPVAGDAGTVAEFLSGQAELPHDGPWRVAVRDRTIEVSDDRGTRARYTAVEHAGRWQVNPIGLLAPGDPAK